MSSSPAPSGSYLTETSDALGGTGTGYALAPGAWFRGTLDSPVHMPQDCREELVKLMTGFADSQLAAAAGLARVLNEGPSLRERMALARIVYEKIQIAETVLEIASTFGADISRYAAYHAWDSRVDRDADLPPARREGDRRLAVFHFPIANWTDGLVMHHLMGRAALIQMEDYTHAGYVPLAEAFRAVIPDETRHGVLAREGVSRELARGHHAAVQASVTYWWPRVAETFGHARSRRERDLRHLGLRRRPNETLRRQWQAEMRAHLDRLHLTTPMQV